MPLLMYFIPPPSHRIWAITSNEKIAGRTFSFTMRSNIGPNPYSAAGPLSSFITQYALELPTPFPWTVPRVLRMEVMCSARVMLALAPIDADKDAPPACKDALKDVWKFLSLVTSASVSGPTTFSGEIAKIVPSAISTLNVKPENRASGAELSDKVARRV